MSTLRLALNESRALTPLDLQYGALLLDLQAARYTPKTMSHYTYTLGAVVGWLQQHGVNSPEETTAHHIKAYLERLQHRESAQTAFAR